MSKAARARRRQEAEARNALTPPERRKSARRDCPTGKLRFASEHAAQVALVGCVIGKNRGKNQRRETRWYECPLCGGLHLTSKPDRAA
jgi:hypothetical protein